MARASRGPSRHAALATLALFAVAATPAAAVVVLDSTWSREGGSKAKAWAGFGAHLRLAAEPQFTAVVALASDGEARYGDSSWFGRVAPHRRWIAGIVPGVRFVE